MQMDDTRMSYICSPSADPPSILSCEEVRKPSKSYESKRSNSKAEGLQIVDFVLAAFIVALVIFFNANTGSKRVQRLPVVDSGFGSVLLVAIVFIAINKFVSYNDGAGWLTIDAVASPFVGILPKIRSFD